MPLLFLLIACGLTFFLPAVSGAQETATRTPDTDSDTETDGRTEPVPDSDSDDGVSVHTGAGNEIAPSAAGDAGSKAAFVGENSNPPAVVGEQVEITSDEEAREGENDDPQDTAAAPASKKKKKKKKLTVSARIHTAWQLKHEDTPDDPLTEADEFVDNEAESKFEIRHARFKMEWRPEKWLTAVLQVGDFQDLEFGFALLRDAYIHVSPFRFLEIRAGQFKKPFSRLALRSLGKIEVVNRGEGDKLLVEDLRYGDRDLGVQFSGSIVPSVELDYEVGFFNGSGPDISEQGNSKDIAARLSVAPFKWFEFGVNGSIKFFEKEENPDKWAGAFGIDTILRVAGFKAEIEHIFGHDYNFRSREPVVVDKAPFAFNLIGIFSYKRDFEGAFKTAVEPVFKIEYLDPDSKVVKDYVLIYAPGFNAYFGKYLRLMIAGEIRRSMTNSATRYENREALIIQLCFDI